MRGAQQASLARARLAAIRYRSLFEALTRFFGEPTPYCSSPLSVCTRSLCGLRKMILHRPLSTHPSATQHFEVRHPGIRLCLLSREAHPRRS
jgi:hypothetical protein